MPLLLHADNNVMEDKGFKALEAGKLIEQLTYLQSGLGQHAVVLYSDCTQNYWSSFRIKAYPYI